MFINEINDSTTSKIWEDPSNCSEEIIPISRYKSIDELKNKIREKILSHESFHDSVCCISNRGSLISLSFK